MDLIYALVYLVPKYVLFFFFFWLVKFYVLLTKKFYC